MERERRSCSPPPAFAAGYDPAACRIPVSFNRNAGTLKRPFAPPLRVGSSSPSQNEADDPPQRSETARQSLAAPPLRGGSSSPSQNEAEDPPRRSEATTESLAASPLRNGSCSPSQDEVDDPPQRSQATTQSLAASPLRGGSCSRSQNEAGETSPRSAASPPSINAQSLCLNSTSRSQIEGDGSSPSSVGASQQESRTGTARFNGRIANLCELASGSQVENSGGPDEAANNYGRPARCVRIPSPQNLSQVLKDMFEAKDIDVERDVFVKIKTGELLEGASNDALLGLLKDPDTGCLPTVSGVEAVVNLLRHQTDSGSVYSLQEQRETEARLADLMQPTVRRQQRRLTFEECLKHMAVATDEAASDLEAPERSFTVGRVKFDAANTTDPFLAATGDQLPLFTSDLDELYDSAIVEGVNDWSLRVESQFSTEHMHSEKFNLMRINIMLPDSYPKIWIGIHQSSLQRLNQILRECVGPRAVKNNRKQAVECESFLRHGTYLLDAQFLETNGIEYFYVRQRPTEVIVTLPGAIFQTVVTGTSCSLERHVAFRRYWTKIARENVLCPKTCRFYTHEADPKFDRIRKLLYEDELLHIVRAKEAARMLPEVDLDHPLAIDTHRVACVAPVVEPDRPGSSKATMEAWAQRKIHFPDDSDDDDVYASLRDVPLLSGSKNSSLGTGDLQEDAVTETLQRIASRNATNLCEQMQVLALERLYPGSPFSEKENAQAALKEHQQAQRKRNKEQSRAERFKKTAFGSSQLNAAPMATTVDPQVVQASYGSGSRQSVSLEQQGCSVVQPTSQNEEASPSKRAKVVQEDDAASVKSDSQDPVLRGLSVRMSRLNGIIVNLKKKVAKFQGKLEQSPGGPQWARDLGQKRAADWVAEKKRQVARYTTELKCAEDEFLEVETARVVYKALRDHYRKTGGLPAFYATFEEDGYTPFEHVAHFWHSESRIVRNALFLKCITKSWRVFKNRPTKVEEWEQHFVSQDKFEEFFRVRRDVRNAARDTSPRP